MPLGVGRSVVFGLSLMLIKMNISYVKEIYVIEKWLSLYTSITPKMSSMKYKEYFYDYFNNTLDCLLSKKNWFYLAILSLPFTIPDIFKKPVPNSTSTDYLVFRLLSAVKSSTLLDTVFWIIVLLLFISFFRKCCRNYQGSFRYFLIILVLTTWYCYVRFSANSEWDILSLNNLTCIKYADLIILHCSLLALTLILNTKEAILRVINKCKKTPPKEEEGSFLTDEPNKEKDDFRRKKLAHKLAERLVKNSNNKQSFGVGIVGQWGSGKTTFLNFIKKWIDNNNKANDIIVIKFNAWQFDNSAILIDDFFNTLKSKLVIFNPELGSKIADYTDHLVNLESNFFTKLSQIGINSLGKENSLDSLFTDINDTIKTLNKKIIVFIDDLDRLDKREVIEVIRLIRNTANFANTTFIVAYDRGYITNAIKGISEYNHETYLEKIFQIEIELPKIESDTISFYIKKSLIGYLPNQTSIIQDYFTLDAQIFSDSNNLSGLIVSIREANRLINHFLLSYDNLKSEVDFVDLLNIEILRIKYPKIYLLLRREKKNDWLMSDNHNWISFRPLGYDNNLKDTYQLAKIQTDNADDVIALEEFLKKEKSQLKSTDIIKIVNIFNTLFHIGTHTPLSIAYPHNFDKYFNYRLFERNLPAREFEDALQNLSVEQFLEKIEEWTKQDRTKDLIIKLKSSTNPNRIKDGSKLKKIIYGAFELRKFSDFSLSTDDISNFIKRLKDEISTPLFQNFIKNLFTKSQRLFVHQWYFLREIDFSIISKEIQIEIFLYNLTTLTEENTELTNTLLLSYITLLEKEITPTQEKKATKLLIDFIKDKDPVGFFIAYFIDVRERRPTENPLVYKYKIKADSPIYRHIFKADVQNLVTFYEGVHRPGSEPQLDEIIRFLNLCLQSNNQSTEFTFENVNINKDFKP